jgi:hypothetical protein
VRQPVGARTLVLAVAAVGVACSPAPKASDVCGAGGHAAAAPLPSARSEIGASTSTLSDGRILVVGGSLPGIVPGAAAFVYDPSADAWSTLPCLPEPRKGAVAFQMGDRIIVTTGSPTSTDPSPSTFVGCCL